MAKPRIFVSSTYFDLRSVRDDLDRFIKGLGYEAVRHESGQISYGRENAPEEYAYREVDLCDILVCVIGGRYGSQSSSGAGSITQRELKTAFERGRQVYIFVEEGVLHEHRYYLANKSVAGVKYTAVDNVKIHEFLEEVQTLPRGNPIFAFGVSSDITAILQEQWAGLFQRLLLAESAKSQTALVEELQRSLQTVGQLVTFLTEQNDKGEQAVQEILFANHPLFDALRKITKNKYRLYFTNLSELEDWLTAARSFERDHLLEMDHDDYFVWSRTTDLKNLRQEQVLYVRRSLFATDGHLLPLNAASWNDDWARLERVEKKVSSGSPFGDDPTDIPF